MSCTRWTLALCSLGLLVFNAKCSTCIVGSITRLGPIVTNGSFPVETKRSDINGPSVIRVPDWIKDPLGKYYLYFADHKGLHIDLAYADHIEGPYTVAHGIKPMMLKDAAHGCGSHVASPDVHVVPGDKTIIMYYHCKSVGLFHVQPSFRAISHDGLHFVSAHVSVGMYYFRRFKVNGTLYAFAKHVNEDTTFLKWSQVKDNGEHLYEPIDSILPRSRHTAVYVFPDSQRAVATYTIVEEAPESIYFSEFYVEDEGDSGDEPAITFAAPCRVLWPQEAWEGALMPLKPSEDGKVDEFVNQLRDPYIYCDEGQTDDPVHIATITNNATVSVGAAGTNGGNFSSTSARDNNGDNNGGSDTDRISDKGLATNSAIETSSNSSNNSGGERSPAVSGSGGGCYLLYAYGGESGLAIAKIQWNL